MYDFPYSAEQKRRYLEKQNTLAAFDLHWDIFQNILFCVPQNKERYLDFKHHFCGKPPDAQLCV